MDPVSYPRHAARTLRFSLGLPRSFSISADGSRVLFLRSASGSDRVNRLWSFDFDSGAESVLVDPQELLGGGDEELPPEEKARRERAREAAGGIVSFSTGAGGDAVAFTLSGRLFAITGSGAAPKEMKVAAAVVQPRIDPTGQRIAYVGAGALRLIDIDSGEDSLLAEPDGPEVTWGLAEFVAGEEMGRLDGFWWAPDGRSLLVARVDNSPVQRWWIADPANPDREPMETAYPAAGTPNAEVSLWKVELDGSRSPVEWDRSEYEYLTRVNWNSFGDPVVQVMSRDQKRSSTFSVVDGGCKALRRDEDDSWIELMSGVPCWLPDGRLLHPVDDMQADTRCLAADGEPLTPPGLQVRAVLAVGTDGIVFSGAEADATQLHIFRWRAGRTERITQDDGVHSATAAGDLLVLASRSLDTFESRTAVLRNGEIVGEIRSLAEEPNLEIRPFPAVVGETQLNTTLLLPRGHRRGEALPVIMDPYGGPHAQRVVAAQAAFATSQWIADQGFAVVVADGRGSPGRGPIWEKSIKGDLSRHALDDQVEALQGLAAEHSDLDLGRVGIRGASFGGYLSALAVLRRPDVFHAAVATASVTDWRLYDTFYTERYLGDPNKDPENYSRSSLLDDASRLERPLLLVHGLADDNVVVAHTLRLSGALLAAGRAHQVLPLDRGHSHDCPRRGGRREPAQSRDRLLPDPPAGLVGSRQTRPDRFKRAAAVVVVRSAISPRASRSRAEATRDACTERINRPVRIRPSPPRPPDTTWGNCSPTSTTLAVPRHASRRLTKPAITTETQVHAKAGLNFLKLFCGVPVACQQLGGGELEDRPLGKQVGPCLLR